MSYKVKRITTIGMLIAMEVVLSRFLSVTIPPGPEYLVKIGFSFLPVAVAAILYGPVWGGVCAALGDIVGTVLFQPGAVYFPGFTVTAFVTGAIFGLFLYEKKVKLSCALFSALGASLLCSLGLNTLWLYVLYKNAVVAMLPGRAVNAAAMIVVETILLLAIGKLMGPYIKKVGGERVRDLRFKARQYFKEKPALRETVSAQLTQNLCALDEYKSARTVFAFVGTDREIDTMPLLEKMLADGKRVCLPVTEDGERMSVHAVASAGGLVSGRFGILEPAHDAPEVKAGEIDLVLVPCSVCDRAKRRVGKGGGYYDRWLADVKAVKAALCPSALVFARVPQFPHDVPMDLVVTEKKILR